jgi:hypothetical protein
VWQENLILNDFGEVRGYLGLVFDGDYLLNA